MGTPRASITFAILRELCDHKAETPSLPFHVEATVTVGQDENCNSSSLLRLTAFWGDAVMNTGTEPGKAARAKAHVHHPHSHPEHS